MTTAQILQELRKGGKRVKLQQLYRYFKQFKIKPAGVRQRPQHYPSFAAFEILRHLGIIQPINGEQPAKPTKQKSRLTPAPAASRSLPSMKQLRAERAKARGTK